VEKERINGKLRGKVKIKSKRKKGGGERGKEEFSTNSLELGGGTSNQLKSCSLDEKKEKKKSGIAASKKKSVLGRLRKGSLWEKKGQQ